MALTYTETAAWNTAGTGSGGDLYYKDVTVSCAAGDLLVAFGTTENLVDTNSNIDESSIATQSGSTSAWTVSRPTQVASNDCDMIGGWATVSSGTSVTVRITVQANGGTVVGGCVYVIPAAEWSGTPAFTNLNGDSSSDSGNVSVTLGSTSTVVMLQADFSAATASTSGTPSGYTAHRSTQMAGNYTVHARSWTNQSSGTRDYGPNGSGFDSVGVVVAVPMPMLAVTPDGSWELFADLATISTTEYFLAADSTTQGSGQSTDNVVQCLLDLVSLQAGDIFRVRAYESVSSSGTARVVFEQTVAGPVPTPILVFPFLVLLHKWDFSLTKIAGTDRSITWSIRTAA